MAFPQNFLQEIKNRISVSDVVGRKVKLQRRGREFVGLSPFKPERTPSFTVNDDKQFYHCFSTGKHGSVFDFLMETEGLSFLEAVEALARQAGLEMPQADPQAAEKAQRQSSLIDVTQAAAGWFADQLNRPTAQAARAYLENRGVSDALAKDFGMGFAPSARRGLVEFLQARNFTIDMIVEAGLAIKPDDGGADYDRFRDRIIFPIHDARGRVIAFGGRAMQADARAKYLNSPATPLFNKSAVLFNFARARQPAYDAKTVLVTEGYMDVIGLARAGITHAVAPLGTAVTEEQIRLLWRLAAEPVMCLDGDQAGLRAAYRAIDRTLPLLKAGYSLRFAMLPAGKDPDDLVREGGAEAMQNVIGRALSMIDLLWEREVEASPWDTPERAAALKQRLRAAVQQITDLDVRALYAQDIKARLDRLLGEKGVPYRASNGRVAPSHRQAWRRQSAKSETRRSNIAQGSGIPPREALIVLCVINHPDLVQKHRDLFERLVFETSSLDKLRFAIIDYADAFVAPLAESAAGLDNEGLTGHLKATGTGELVDQLRQMPEALTLGFVRQDSNLDIVEAGWLEVVELHHTLKTLMDERAEAEADFAIDSTQENFERLSAIVNQIAALEQRNDKTLT